MCTSVCRVLIDVQIEKALGYCKPHEKCTFYISLASIHALYSISSYVVENQVGHSNFVHQRSRLVSSWLVLPSKRVICMYVCILRSKVQFYITKKGWQRIWFWISSWYFQIHCSSFMDVLPQTGAEWTSRESCLFNFNVIPSDVKLLNVFLIACKALFSFQREPRTKML